VQLRTEDKARVIAVVVTYEPDETLIRAVGVLAPQVAAIVIVDNGSAAAGQNLLGALKDRARVELLGRNLGIGAAHNLGIRRARALGATHVMLLDQDSVPSSDMVVAMLKAENDLVARGCKVGALGPIYTDPQVRKSWPFYRISRFGVRALACDGHSYVRCDFLISSGTLIRTSVIDVVGAMNERYFLEHVDTEWSLRARFAGYQLFGVCGARMQHRLGESAVDVPIIGRRVQVYRPYRHYYLFRNSILLWRERHACLPWKLNEIKRLLYRLVLFPIFVAPRVERLKFMLLGLWHGLLGRTGPLEAWRSAS
jgi:rhamnosyltransferase